MADIIGQQKREQEIVREAVAKRSLQEIQQEQAFEAWWDQETRRTQGEEQAKRQSREKEKDDRGRDKQGRLGHGGKGRKPRGGGAERSDEHVGNGAGDGAASSAFGQKAIREGRGRGRSGVQ
jgi:inhibitor of Bruton tyrosine kinase